MFVRHSPGAATREIAPTATPPATTMRRSKPGGRDELLKERSVPLEPEPVLELVEVAAQRDLVLAALDVAAPAAEARLDDDRPLPVRHRATGVEDARARVRQAGAGEHLRRQQLVVGREERSRAVEHADAPRGERAERPETVLHPVEALGDVEPAEGGAAAFQERRRLLGRQDPGVDPVRRRGGERDVRGGATLGDDREQHDFSIAEKPSDVGYRTVKILCPSGALLGVRRVGELAELAGDEVRGLLADVDGVVADPLEAARDEDHPQPPLALLRLVPDVEQAADDAAVRAVDQLVELDERLGPLEIALRERVECDADHLLGALRPSPRTRRRASRPAAGRSASFDSFAIVTQ